jgi:hypothetical protein
LNPHAVEGTVGKGQMVAAADDRNMSGAIDVRADALDIGAWYGASVPLPSNPTPMISARAAVSCGTAASKRSQFFAATGISAEDEAADGSGKEDARSTSEPPCAAGSRSSATME